MSDKPSLETLKVLVAGGQSSLLSRFKDRVAAVEDLRLWAVVGGVAGTVVTASARAITGELGLSMTISGASFAACCGLIVALMDRKKLDISREAADAHSWAEEAIAIAEGKSEALQDLEGVAGAFDGKRRARLMALRRMIEEVEAQLVGGNGDVKSAAEAMLRQGIQHIRSAVDFKGEDFFTVTIFLEDETGKLMTQVAAEWTDPALAKQGGRHWVKGRGYTGRAWESGRDVIVPDSLAPGVIEDYPVDDRDPERERLYRSIAAIPVRVEGNNRIWGIVTATSNRENVFSRDQANLSLQNVEMVQDIARVTSLLAGLARNRSVASLQVIS